jgi:hypothetical protein
LLDDDVVDRHSVVIFKKKLILEIFKEIIITLIEIGRVKLIDEATDIENIIIFFFMLNTECVITIAFKEELFHQMQCAKLTNALLPLPIAIDAEN